jgi:hypothetical protein
MKTGSRKTASAYSKYTIVPVATYSLLTGVYCHRHFWSVVHELSTEEKKKLLMFSTGSDRVPIRGLSNLVFVISKNGSDPDRLPSAHTWYVSCINFVIHPEEANVLVVTVSIISFYPTTAPARSSRSACSSRSHKRKDSVCVKP